MRVRSISGDRPTDYRWGVVPIRHFEEHAGRR